MRVSTYTGLTLFEWAEIMGISPWEMAQIGTGFTKPSSRQCDHVFFQFPWQRNAICREEIGRAIQRAENDLANYLGYWPSPRFFANEAVVYPRPAQRYLFGGGGTPRFMLKAIPLKWGYVQGGGILARTLIGTAAVVMTDPDGDGASELFTVTQATTITDPDEIAVYFVPTDRNNVPVDETWRIRPVQVSISGGNAVITGHPAQLVLPNKTTTADPQILDVTGTIYATNVEVYRVFRDTTYSTTSPNQGRAEWEVIPGNAPPAGVAYVPVTIGARDAELGKVVVDYTLAGTQVPPQDREPDRLMLNYQAGIPLYNGRVNEVYAKLVAILAASYLTVGTCACERSQQIIHSYRAIPSEDLTGRQLTRMLTWNEIDKSPFGPTNGGLEVWRRAFYLRNGQAGIA